MRTKIEIGLVAIILLLAAFFKIYYDKYTAAKIEAEQYKESYNKERDAQVKAEASRIEYQKKLEKQIIDLKKVSSGCGKEIVPDYLIKMIGEK